jgi:hypothetical protein
MVKLLSGKVLIVNSKDKYDESIMNMRTGKDSFFCEHRHHHDQQPGLSSAAGAWLDSRSQGDGLGGGQKALPA